MAKGGARARSGPAPDPNALRRDRDAGDWITLPVDGRDGPAPEWPLTGAAAHLAVPIGDDEHEAVEAAAERWFAREMELWAREWRRPQAVVWERNGQELEVALYVRSLAAAERADAPVNLRTLVKQQQEALGISLPGMARNRWRIAHEVPAAAPARAPGRSARDRFKVVTGGGAA